MLTGNSYGGFIATEAAKGLSRSSADPDEGDIVHMVYITSHLAPVGVNVYELLGSELPVSADPVTTECIPAMPAEAAGALSFSELPVEQQIMYGAVQKPQSA